MQEYKIISRLDQKGLEKSINEWLALGWSLQGGVSVMSYPPTDRGIHQNERIGFFQAIVNNKQHDNN